MEEILSSIKRIIADEGETATGARARRAVRSPAEPGSFGHDEILELSDPVRREPVTAATPAAGVKPAGADPILSSRAAEASRGSLDALSRMVVRPEVAGSDTLEALVREMLRPMLRDWLERICRRWSKRWSRARSPGSPAAAEPVSTSLPDCR